MSEEYVGVLVERLSDKDGLVRERARHTLALVGEPAVPSLLELLKSSAKRPRWEAAKTLAAIGDSSSVSALVGVLTDPESDIRWLGAVGLIRLGPRSLSDLLRLLIERPDSTHIRRGARHVFKELGRENPVAQEFLAPVLEVLGDTNPASAIPPRAEEALQELRHLRGEDTLQR